uniref:Cytochrome c oxidase subunit 2 n=1 Tax=Walchia hayashii TaxID=436352 RepID=B3IUL5_9ACAR|nr:cytochrome c oxidase subunit II [Walchia hayashii]BAG24169.1 cytochrome oxidase subunit 2 [Walchia hayashii]
MPMWSTISHQNSTSPLMENLSSFHDHIMIILMLVLSITGMMGILTTSKKIFIRTSKESQEMEIFWSSLPTVILMMMAIPSLKLLYLTEEQTDPSMTMKITGHQWYWSYEYSDIKKISFDSFMTTKNPRNLMTSNHTILPTKSPIRFLITSTDVIHSWAMPSMGMKMDAMPGRMNQFSSTISRSGMYSGQCSEICGMKHSFMPITISSIPPQEFYKSMKMM